MRHKVFLFIMALFAIIGCNKTEDEVNPNPKPTPQPTKLYFKDLVGPWVNIDSSALTGEMFITITGKLCHHTSLEEADSSTFYNSRWSNGVNPFIIKAMGEDVEYSHDSIWTTMTCYTFEEIAEGKLMLVRMQFDTLNASYTFDGEILTFDFLNGTNKFKRWGGKNYELYMMDSSN